MVLGVETGHEDRGGGGDLNTEEMAADYIKRARTFLKEARFTLGEEDYPTTVRRAQECIEISVKAVLRALSVEFPKEHEVSEVLLSLEIEEPVWFKENRRKIADIMRETAPHRGPAMYGFEKELRPASELFGKEDAEEALKDADFVHQLCKRFLKEGYGIGA